MFEVLYIIPSLYLLVLAAFGTLALLRPNYRRPICLILAPAVVAAGLLALMLGEWIPVAVMGSGGSLFAIAALTSRAAQPD
jgi:uncharacterized membrane protein YjjP (DUF1212 family)